MSTIQEQQGPWTSLAGQPLDPKYEKCRNITEEIYKRINITFQIKKLESGEQSDLSDNSEQIDSNELSNETDLFACDKSDISSSEGEGNVAPVTLLPVLLNNNNNEERKQTVYKRPRKRFRKRVKKRAPRHTSFSEGSSDEAPLARSLLILSPDLKPKSPEKYIKKSSRNNLTLRELLKPDDIKVPTVIIEKIIDKHSAQNTDSAVKNFESVRYSIKQSDKTTEKEVKLTIDKKSPITDNKNQVAKHTEDFAVPNSKMGVENLREMKMFRNLTKVDTTDKEFSIVDERKKYSKEVKVTDWKNCSVCNLSFRGERGLRRHMSMSHIESPEIGK